MKQRLLCILIAVLTVLSLAGCGGRPLASESNEEDAEKSLILPGGPGQENGEQPEEEPSEEEQKKSDIYPPSIFVMEVSGTYRQELEPGYYADYEIEFYADKLDELDLQSVSGHYNGVFWMKVTMDTADYLKDLLKDIPVDMQFDAGGEGICDSISIILMNEFERHSMGGSFDIPEQDGGSIVPESGALAARSSFTVTPISAYLDVLAQGAAGESLEHHDNQSDSTEVDFIIHVEPDPDGSKTERKVTMHISIAGGMNATFEGVLRRLPGYSEDLKAYTSQGKRGEILDKHLP